jgi:hypothetical protein
VKQIKQRILSLKVNCKYYIHLWVTVNNISNLDVPNIEFFSPLDSKAKVEDRESCHN